MNKSILKRVMSTVLTLALVVSSINWATVTKVNADENVMQITDGQIVAANYGLGMTEAEVVLLSNKDIAGEVHQAVAPTEDDNLVSVNSDTGVITAADYKDQFNNVWKAVLATILVDEEVVESVDITDGEGYIGYDGDNYDISVVYETETAVANQAAIASIPYYLAKGVENLDILLDDCSAGLSLVEEYLPYMTQLVDGSLGKSIDDGPAKDAINALNKQLADNEGILDLTKLVADGVKDDNISYEEAASQVEFLFTKGADVKTCTIATYKQLKAIFEEEQISEVVALATVAQPTMANMLNRAMKNIADLVDDLAPVYGDEWKALTAKTVKDGADYAALDDVVANAIGDSKEHDFEDAESLLLADTAIEVSVNRYEVEFKVIVNTVEGIDTTETFEGYVSTATTFPAGTTKAELEAYAEAKGLEASIAKFFGEDVTTANYNRTVTALPDTLTENVQYVITYSPKTVKIDGFMTKEVPYGYNLTLPMHSDLAMSYDYDVNGETYFEDSIVRIEGDTTITRTEGKKRTTYTYGEIIANDYWYDTDPTTALSDTEKAILSNAAFVSDTVAVRLPDNEADDQIVISGQTITAKDYDAGYDDNEWIPSAYNIYKGDELVEGGVFDGATSTFTSTDYDYIEVEYMLGLRNWDDADVLELVNTPYTLIEEAKAQKADLAKLLNPKVYDNLGSINKTMLTAMSANLGEESQDAIRNILNNAFNNQTGYFYLYEHMTNYKTEGLAYYYSYNNCEEIKKQVSILADQLAIIAADPELPAVLEDTGYGEFKEKIDDATDILNDAKSGFVAPNEAIDCYSDSLDSLVSLIETAIDTEGAVKEYTETKGVNIYSYLSEAAADRSVLTLESQKLDSNGKVVASNSTNKIVETGSSVLGSEIIPILDNLDLSLFESDSENAYYDGSDSLMFVDTTIITVDGDMKITRTHTPKKYVVNDIEGSFVGNVYYGDRKIQLPVGDANVAYQYSINGEAIKVSSNGYYTLTDAQFAALVNGAFELTVKEIDINYNETLALIEELNSALATNADNELAFIPVDVNGQLQAVLRLPANDSTKALTDSMTALSQALMSTKYTYIGIDDNAIINSGMVSMQALADTIVGFDGLGTQTVLDVIDENGDINEMTIENGSIVDASAADIVSPEVYGGEIACGTLQLAVSDEVEAYAVPLHITIEDFDTQTENLKKVRAGVEKLVNYVTIECGHDHVDEEAVCVDRVNVTVTAPDDAYAVLLGEMLVSGNLELSDINNPNIETMVDYNRDLVEPIINDDALTAQTIENTLIKLGFDKDLSAYDSAFVKFLKGLRYAFNDVTISVDTEETTNSEYVFYAFAPVDEFVNKAPDAIKNLIVDSEIVVRGKLELTNIEKDYEAVIIDNTKDGLDKFTMTTNAVASIADAGDSSLVMLLGDVEGDVHFNNSAILNLNGYKIDGNLTSDATVTVMDSGVANDGSVTGSVSGDFVITGGVFTADVTAMIPEGYIQRGGTIDPGKVYNTLYELVITEDGYEFVVDASNIIGEKIPSKAEIAKSIALDIALNEYTSATADLDGRPLYNFEVVNILDSNVKDVKEFIKDKLETVDFDTISYFVNDVVDQLSDFAAVSKAASKGEALATYELTIDNWELSANIVEGEDYIDVSAARDNSNTAKSIELKIGGSEEDIDILTAVCAELDKVVELNSLNVEFKEDSEALVYYVDVNSKFDFAIDSNYAIVLGIILANNSADNTALVEGLKDALAENPSYDKLVAELEKVSINDLTAANAVAREEVVSDMLNELGISVAEEAVAEITNVYTNGVFVILNWLDYLSDTVGEEVLVNNKVAGTYATYDVVKRGSGLFDATLQFVLCEEPLPPTEAPTVAPTATPEATPTASPEATPTASPEATPTVTPTVTPTATPTVTPKATPTATPEAPTETPTTPPTDKPLIYGDVDGNGVVEAKDALLVLKYIADLTELTDEQLEVSDVNGDGIVDSVDALLILKKAADLIPELPVERQDILGDVDFGGIVRAQDALLVLKHCAKLITLEEKAIKSGDVNRDGALEPVDALLILKKAAKLIEDFE